MAIIRKKIENLKAGQDYILSVQARNSDLNTSNDPLAAIRFTVPRDSTVPADIANLELYASFQNVMFKFDFGQEEDISHYLYELYSQNDTSEQYLVTAGRNAANVFTIAVENSSQEAGSSANWRSYWGRVKAVDTSGNESNWTSLVQTDENTPLIDEQFIDSLTASKITAGTIGAHTITLNGANSILQSSNFSTGSTGWQIKGDGTAEFDSQYIRGNLNAASVTIGDGTYNYWNKSGAENDFRVGDSTTYLLWDNSEGTLTVAGDATISGTLSSVDGTFSGTLNAVDGTFSGTLSGVGGTFTSNVTVGSDENKITIASGNTAAETKIYSGAGNYNNANTGFYIDASGQFSLGNKLFFDQATGDLNLNGNPSGASSDLIIEGAIIRTVQDVDDAGSTADGVVMTENDIFLYSRTTDESSIKFQGSTTNIAKIISEIKGIQLSATSSQGSPIFQVGTNNTSTENYLMYKWYGYSSTEVMTLSKNGSSNPSILDLKNNTSILKTGNITLRNEGSSSGLSINWDEDTSTGIFRHNPGTGYTGVALVAQGIEVLSAIAQSQTNGRVKMEAPTTTTTSGFGFLLHDNSLNTVHRHTSSRDLKDNIKTIGNIDSFFDAVRPVSFVRKADDSTEETEEEKFMRLSDVQHGFIAEELAEIFDGRLATYDLDFKPVGWRWPDMIAMCVAEIKSLRSRVAQLESL